MNPDRRERVLVVDDDPAMRRTLERVLSPLYDVEPAEGARAALARARARRFDVALVDIQLPDGDGYALCRSLREVSPETDFILITGSISQADEKLYRSLEEGAFYFLFKPFERRVLRALVARCVALQRERRAKEKYARELAADLERARRFQRSLMPEGALREGGWHADGRFLPCQALGGDFYFALVNRDRSVSIAISDVVGHGVGAAMYAGMFRSVLDAARRREPDPSRVLREILHGIQFFEAGRYATCVYVQLRLDGHIRYFSAGHPPVLLRRRSGEVRRLESTGTILNPLLTRTGDEIAESEMSAGDRLVLFTDGLYEALDPGGHELGVDRLAALLGEDGGRAMPEVLDRLLVSLKEHSAGRPLVDDATVLMVERR
jgi:sigma-B regulation protein RsbU (phosphoserine phosphatase)